MAGHSKWAQIKRKKGATDAKRGQLFSKLARRSSWLRGAGPIPPETLRSRTRSRRPRKPPCRRTTSSGDRIEEPGPSADGAAYETVTYEGMPAGVAVYVEAVTDNRNRTAAEVRHIFAKADGSLGESGSVAWLFERRAAVLVDGSADETTSSPSPQPRAVPTTSSTRATAGGDRAPEALGSVREAVEAAA